jgi:hypothetical protein
MEGIIITGMILGSLILMFAVIGYISIKEERIKAQARGAVDGQERINAETTAELARLRSRLEVLERVITDDDRKLAREITQLRADQARATAQG